MPTYLLFESGTAGKPGERERGGRAGIQCVLPRARAPTEDRAARLSVEGGRSLEGPGATVSENNL